jgi:hypothetical protein
LTAPYGLGVEVHSIRVLRGEECIENARPFHRMMAARGVDAILDFAVTAVRPRKSGASLGRPI